MKNKERIALLEKRVQALESAISGIKSVKIDTTIPESTLVNIQSDINLLGVPKSNSIGVDCTKFVKDKNGNGIVMHKDGGYTVYPNMDMSKSYVVPNPKNDKSLITDWLDRNGNPEIEAKVEADLALESVKRKVTELIELQGYVSVGDDGEIWCHNGEPKTLNHDWYHDGRSRYVAIMNLNGADWTKCCWKISDLLVNHLDGADYSAATVLYSITNPKPDTQPDWENLFTLEEIRGLLSTDRSVEQFHNTITGVVYDRIKPLLDEIDSLKTQVKDEHALTTAYMYGRQNLLDSLKKIQIEVPFELDEDEEFLFPVKDMGLFTHLSSYCKRKNIDPKQIKRITLEMKSEVEE